MNYFHVALHLIFNVNYYKAYLTEKTTSVSVSTAIFVQNIEDLFPILNAKMPLYIKFCLPKLLNVPNL